MFLSNKNWVDLVKTCQKARCSSYHVLSYWLRTNDLFLGFFWNFKLYLLSISKSDCTCECVRLLISWYQHQPPQFLHGKFGCGWTGGEDQPAQQTEQSGWSGGEDRASMLPHMDIFIHLVHLFHRISSSNSLFSIRYWFDNVYFEFCWKKSILGKVLTRLS